MTVAAEPRQELVLLEPRDRVQIDLERAALVAEVEKELPAEIVSPIEYEAIADLERRLGLFIARHEPVFDDHCSLARKVWLQACEIRGQFLDAPKTLKAKCRVLLGHYKEREERLRRDEERRLSLEEQAREEKRLKQEAKLAEKQGQPELAKAIRNTPVEAPAIVLPSAVPAVGLTFQERWTWEIVGGDTAQNRTKALAMIVRPEYLGLVKWDDAGLTAHAVRTRGTVRVPGIKFFSKQVPVRR